MRRSARVRRAGMLAITLMASTALAAPSSAAGYGHGQVLFTFQDDRINESSGVVASSRRDGLYFTHNDSGDTARFFAVDTAGCTLATYDLLGFDESFRTGHDVEDVARGPLPSTGESTIWLADIGDNLHQRGEIYVYGVAEPNVNNSAVRASGTCPTTASEHVAATAHVLRYPDHPHDAETLLADPRTGQLFIVTKTPFGQASVYAAPVPLSADEPNLLALVTTIELPPSTTYDKNLGREVENLVGSTPDAPYTQPVFDLQGRFSTTGGDIAPDRSRLVIRSYTDAWEWTLGELDLRSALLAAPVQHALEYQRQGEAITYTRDGRSLVTTCEDIGCPAHLYPAS